MSQEVTKLELGCGPNPTPGYFHTDITEFDCVDLVAAPWDIDLPDNSLEEVIALGVMEHLTYEQCEKCLVNVSRMLKPGGKFYFDVPDIRVWCKYVVDHFEGKETPFPIHHLLSTLYGWQRWPGDEHQSGWYTELLEEYLEKTGFEKREYGVEYFLNAGHKRNRFFKSHDAHLYCVAEKS